MAQPICDVKLESAKTTIVHSCYLHPHTPESRHECVCGKRWMSPDSYGIVTAAVKNSS